jgi:hypothetical protein
MSRLITLTKKAEAFAICITDVGNKDNEQAKLGE